MTVQRRRATLELDALDLDVDIDVDLDGSSGLVTERFPRHLAYYHCICPAFVSRSGIARHPFRRAMLAMRHSVEAQFAGDCAIGQAVGYECDHLLFARRQQSPAVGVDDAKRWHLR